MLIVIATQIILFAIGVILITVGATLLLAHAFNGYYKLSTGIATFLIGIVFIALALMLSNSNLWISTSMHMW